MGSRELAIGSDAFAGAGKADAERGLVEMCRRGDAEAFARLVGLHESMVYNLSARLLGDGEEARDLSQDVFLQVYRTLGAFHAFGALRTLGPVGAAAGSAPVVGVEPRHPLGARRRLGALRRLCGLRRLGALRSKKITAY